MSLVWTTEVYDQAYTRYNHQWATDSDFLLYRNALTTLASRSTYTPADEVLFVGCGFGYWMEYLLTVPGVQPDRVWGTDPGPHITTNKNDPTYCNPSILPKVLNLDIFSPSILNDLKPFFGGNGKVGGWVVSTLTLTSLQNDTEISNFALACENIIGPQGQIGHFFTSAVGLPHDSSFGMNWQVKEYWSTRLPDHWLFDLHGWKHPEATPGDPAFIGTIGEGYFGVWNPNSGAWE